MELIVLGGLGLTGYYLNSANNTESFDTDLDAGTDAAAVEEGRVNADTYKDIYTRNDLTNNQRELIELAKLNYQKSMRPQSTNIIPSSYNKLAPYMREKKHKSHIDLQYYPDEDTDHIYQDIPLKMKLAEDIEGTPNEIFRSHDIDTAHLFLYDEYQMQMNQDRSNKKPYVIPGVARNTQPTYAGRKVPRRSAAEIIETYQNIDAPDKDLLSISQNMTDNGISLRQIIDGTYKASPPHLSPTEMAKTGRLVGVTPDYGSIIVDDEVASYPKFDRYLKKKPDIKSNRPGFLEQFEEQTFDSNGLPGASNDIYDSNNKGRLADLERQLAFQGGWSQYDQGGSMSYGIVPDDQLVHDNMVPFFKEKNGYGTNDLKLTDNIDRQRDLYTGNMTVDWRKKQEIPKLFAPVKDMSYIYGTPVRPEGEESRLFTSRYRNNEKLFNPEMVTPGLNLGYNEVGTQGYQDLTVIYPKTVDELRVASKPKTTYEGRMIEGMRGTEGPIMAPIVSRRPTGFKVTTEDDLLPTTALNTGPKIQDNVWAKDTNRETTTTEYTGGAFNKQLALDQTAPDVIKPLVKESNRQNFLMPKPLQKYAREETAFNPNLPSFNIQATARADTGHTNHVGVAGSHTAIYSNLTDQAKSTQRESMAPIDNTRVTGNTMRGFAVQMDVARDTIKQTTVGIPLQPGSIHMPTSAQKVYSNDIARPTIKETTIEQLAPSNVVNTTMSTYANLMDGVRNTIKETTTGLQRNTVLTAVGQTQANTQLQDQAKTTMKEQFTNITYNNNLTPVGQTQGTVGLQDQAKTTLKEQFTNISYNNNLTPVGQAQGTVGLQDQAKTTLKEQLTDKQTNTNLTAVGQAQGSVGLQDQAKTTTREQLTDQSYNTNVTAVGQQKGTVGLQDSAKTTLREQLTDKQTNTVVTAVGQQKGLVPLQDQAKTTMKEQTVTNQAQTYVTAVGQQQGTVGLQDQARTTLKEQTIDNDYVSNVTMGTYGQGYGYLSTNVQAPATSRQLISEESYVAPAQSQNSKPIDYQSTYKSAILNNKRSFGGEFRPFTQGGAPAGPTMAFTQTQLKSNSVQNTHLNPASAIGLNNQEDRPASILSSRIHEQIPISYFLDPSIIGQLKNNPYSLPSYYPNPYAKSF